METVPFGSTGLTVSRLAIGTGTNATGKRSDQTDLGLDGLVRLLHLGYEHGVTFWDAADTYGCHPHLARALKTLPRERIVIATKIAPRSTLETSRAVERILRELRTDVLDIVLLHCMTAGDWPQCESGAMDALSRAKQEGKVRAVGVSCHSLRALKAAARSDWTQVVLARINFAGAEMDTSPQETVPVIERLYLAGKAVYGMKVLGCGHLADRVPAAIEYVLRLGTVHALTIGMTNADQLLEAAHLVGVLSRTHRLRDPKTA